MQSKKKSMALKLHRYKWRGEDKKAKKLAGTMDATSSEAVHKILQNQNIQNIKIRKSLNLRIFQNSKITSKDVNAFTKQFAILVKSNIEIIRALDLILLSQTKFSFREVLLQIRDEIASGTSIDKSFAKYPHIFNAFYCGVLQAGIASGRLSQMLQELINYQEKLAAINAKVKKALTYPLFVLLFGFGVSAFLLVTVIPKFEAMFNNFGSQLPWITAKVLHLSNLVQIYYMNIIFFLSAIFIFIYYLYKKIEPFKYRMALMLLRLPLVAKLISNILTARFARLLSLCFSADIRIVDALLIAKTAIANPVFSKKIDKVAQSVNLGQKLSFAMRNEKIFPNLMLQLVAIGEETSNLPILLNQASDFFEIESNNMLDKFTSLLEPLVIIILGGIIGVLVISIYLPIFTLNSAIGG